MNIDVNNLTLGQIKEIAALVNSSSVSVPVDNSAWEIGAIYLIRTVTMIDTGRLVAVTANELVLEDAAWIADTGRFSEAVSKAEFGEVEPFPDGRIILGRGGVIDAVKISKAPRSIK
jgi:hypothetical protein